MRLVLLAGMAGGWVWGQSLTDCRAFDHRGATGQAQACYRKLTASPDPFIQAEALWALGDFQLASKRFEEAVKRKPKSADYRVRWGLLFLERFNATEAAKLFGEALEIDENHVPAMTGMARAAAERFDPKAVEMAEKALEKDPKYVAARSLLARLTLEDSNPARAVEEANKALALDAENLEAMSVLAAVDLLANKGTSPWFGRILAINPVYGEAHAMSGDLLVLNRRYTEGIAEYEKALALKPALWSARADLGVNLMRLGREAEARRHLELCYENSYRDAKTVNTLKLMDSYKNFDLFETPNTILRLNKKESALLRPYMEAELKKAIAVFEKKYGVKLTVPVQLEVYPNHEDFAVRTMGMPGLGALGVTFGTVVAMDSPSGRRPGGFHWASTLWHELSHVFVLTATKHQVPRWFTEGLAVYEETAVEPDWGDRLDPETITAIKEKKLLPIAQLDRGFIRPKYQAQVIVSYFQAGRICSYIAEKWGFPKLMEMMHEFTKATPTPEVVEKLLGMKAEEFDKQFLAWVEAQTKTTVEGFAEWQKAARAVTLAARDKKWDEVIKDGPRVRDLFPDYVEGGSIYELLADAYMERKDKGAAMAELERYARVGGRNPATLKRLAQWQEEAGRLAEAARTLDKINYIYPVQDEELHRRLGGVAMKLGQLPLAIREYRAVVALTPIDQASAHFNLARALHAAGRMGEAEEESLLALEAAPGYKPAQKLLLELSQSAAGKETLPVKNKEQ
ncbi:MAG: tetratricopeptide repeat protein [Acidobacteria bacterium]|nr:tetratricopeptide repeat protein [Acidobacteriota bacterium]